MGAARANFTGDTVRGFSSNLATDRARHQDIREDFRLAPEKYFRLSNRETLKKAQDIFSAGLDSARSTVEQAIGAAQAGQKLSPEMVPLSKMVADALAARGDPDGARNILSSMAAELIYNMDKDDGVTTADKKRMLREMFGWEGNAIYKALGEKIEDDED